MHDDEPVGHLFSRREVVALLGVAGVAWLTHGTGNAATPSAPACVVRPQQTEGPFFVDGDLNRSDIRDGKGGTPLALALTISRLNKDRCEPLPDAQVDLWHCDAAGVYSGVGDRESFLRGYQATDDRGAARFVTIYPGWYPGRTVHIHFKVRANKYEFTSQLYFDDAMTDRVHAAARYSAAARRTRNDSDGIFRRGGEQLQLEAIKSAGMLRASFAMAMQF
ncbi:MAG TPA: intradiol ring-cleavage dioxygenase [Thermoanaerobaculia bacterium]|nr:intradiol ring-cleavage dioxygenase [Thermoanaerobaculia bacterium]